MDDRRAHFLTMLGDACMAADLASIPVELVLSDGTRIIGAPAPQLVDSEKPQVNETGYPSLLLIGGVCAQLEDVVGFVIRAP